MKEKIPITILKALEKFVQLKGDKFESVESENSLMKVIGLGKASDFYFTIESSKLDGNYKQFVQIERCPKAENSLEPIKTNVEINQLQASFNAWLELISSYDTVRSVYDDSILESYTEEYFAEFEIVEEDATINPFNTKQVLLLDEHLEEIEEGISKFKNDANQQEIDLVILEVKLLRESLTQQTKAKVTKELSKIWARITKLGVPVFKEFINEAKKQLIKDGVRTLLDAATDLIG